MRSQFCEKTRNKQLDFLSDCADKEASRGLGYAGPGFHISAPGVSEYCQCAETAIMLLNTQFAFINVWVKRAFTPNQIRGK